MNRRMFLAGLVAVPALPMISRISLAQHQTEETTVNVRPLDVSHDYWRDKVSDKAYNVLFEEATERAGSSPLATCALLC